MTALATDIGGTFTDVVLVADGRVHVAKTLTTPDDPTEGLLRGVRRVLADAGVAPASVDRFAHATTLATNVILERRGAAVAFVTTRGLRSMLALGRQARVEEERYDLAFSPGEPPVPLTHTFEVPERLGVDGTVLTRVLAANSRTPDKLLGDLRALVAGANVAARRVEALAAEQNLAAGVGGYLGHTEARMREELARLPRGTYEGEYAVEDGDDRHWAASR